MSRRVMTLAQFRASGRDVPDLGEAWSDAGAPCNPPQPGRVYAGPCAVARLKSEWVLIIENHEYAGQGARGLARLERLLYGWYILTFVDTRPLSDAVRARIWKELPRVVRAWSAFEDFVR